MGGGVGKISHFQGKPRHRGSGQSAETSEKLEGATRSSYLEKRKVEPCKRGGRGIA